MAERRGAGQVLERLTRGAPRHQGDVGLALGLVEVAGQREPARTALSTAIEMYSAMDMTFWLPQTEAALAQVEGR